MTYPKYYNPDTGQWEFLPLGYEGLDGLSAYEIAVQQGFEGTEEEWLASLHVNLTAEEIKTLYESNEDTNVFNDSYRLKVDNLWTISANQLDLSTYVTTDQLLDYVTLQDLGGYVTTQDLSDYVNLTDLLNYATLSDVQSYVDSASNSFTEPEKIKLAGIETGAQVNVQSDWSAISGDAYIQNKPTLGTAAALNVGTSANNVVQLDATSRLPAVDGSQLLNLPEGFIDPMTTPGDILVRNSSNVTSRLGIGTVNQLLSSNGTDLIWASVTHSYITDWDTNLAGTTNTSAFTPTSDYHPATKKYVDETILNAGGYTDENARDAVASVLSTQFTYTDALDTTGGIAISSISADIVTNGTTNKVFTATDKSKLDGIETGAEVNVQSDWNAVSGDAFILNKPDLSGYLTSSNTTPYTPTNDYNPATKLYVDQAIVNAGGYTDENAQDAVGGILSNEFTYNDSTPLISVSSLNVDKLIEGTTNKLFTATLKTKLDGIATGAEVNVQADWNAVSGDALILNKPTLLTTNDVQSEIDAVQFPTYVTVAASTINCSLGIYFYKEVNGNITFSFSNLYPAGTVYSCTLEVKHVSGTITWPAAVSWPGGVAPNLTINKTHIFTFVTIDGGVKWRGTALPDYTI